MELVWYRMLTPILGGTTFTFGMILAVALLGISIGRAMYPLVVRRRRPDLRLLTLTLAGKALAIAIPFGLGDRLAVLAWILLPLASYGFAGQVFGWFVVTMIVVFPAAAMSGLQFPVLIALAGEGSENLGLQMGRTVGYNTAARSWAHLRRLWSDDGAHGPRRLETGRHGACALRTGACRGRFRRTRLFRPSVLPLCMALAAAGCLMALGPTAVWRHTGIGAGQSLSIDQLAERFAGLDERHAPQHPVGSRWPRIECRHQLQPWSWIYRERQKRWQRSDRCGDAGDARHTRRPSASKGYERFGHRSGHRRIGWVAGASSRPSSTWTSWKLSR